MSFAAPVSRFASRICPGESTGIAGMSSASVTGRWLGQRMRAWVQNIKKHYEAVFLICQ